MNIFFENGFVHKMNEKPYSFNKFKELYNCLEKGDLYYDNHLNSTYRSIFLYFSLGISPNYEKLLEYLEMGIVVGNKLAIGFAMFLSKKNIVYSRFKYLLKKYKRNSLLMEFHSQNPWDMFSLIFTEDTENLKRAEKMGSLIAVYYLNYDNQDKLKYLIQQECVYAMDKACSKFWLSGYDPLDIFQKSVNLSTLSYYGYGIYLMGCGIYNKRFPKDEEIALGLEYILKSDKSFYPNMINLICDIVNMNIRYLCFLTQHKTKIEGICSYLKNKINNEDLNAKINSMIKMLNKN
jgi:hypothetical protein